VTDRQTDRYILLYQSARHWEKNHKKTHSVVNADMSYNITKNTIFKKVPGTVSR